MRTALLKRSIPPSSIEIMLASLSDNSIKQYNVCLKRWHNFCRQNNRDIFVASIPTVIYFLTQLFHSGAQYGSLNSYRGALSLLLGSHISIDDRIKRFFKGVFRLRPPTPKYEVTWDTNIVLDSLSEWYPNETLPLERLSRKCATLLALATAHRVQTLNKILLCNIESQSSQIIIKIPDLVKTSRAGDNQPLLRIPFFTDKTNICPATTLLCYINKTASLRQDENLFIAFKKPYKAVTTQSVSRWIKATLKDCGVDVTIFTAHSTRHASTSKAYHKGVNVDVIRRTAGWSGNSTTFGKFYNRIVHSSVNQTSLASAVFNDD